MPKKLKLDLHADAPPLRATLHDDLGLILRSGQTSLHITPEEVRELLKWLNQNLVLDAMSLLDSPHEADQVGGGQPGDGDLSQETDTRG